jgi:hypothetical protein
MIGIMAKWILRDGKLIEAQDCAPSERTLYFSIKKGGYNHGLGAYIGNKHDKRGAINRIYDETGQKLEEVGTDYPTRNKQKNNYELNGRERQKLNEILDGS